jgi:hypothetical protein
MSVRMIGPGGLPRRSLVRDELREVSPAPVLPSINRGPHPVPRTRVCGALELVSPSGVILPASPTRIVCDGLGSVPERFQGLLHVAGLSADERTTLFAMDVGRCHRMWRSRLAATAAVLVFLNAPEWSSAGPADRAAGAVSAHARISEVEEHAEDSVLWARNVPGALVQVSPGSPGGGVGVSVHGINARCSDVDPLTLELAERGALTLAFVYDDNYRRLWDSAVDLAAALRPYLEGRPGEPLFVRAHSMGARIVLVALERLGREGALAGRDLDVALVAPPLGGYRTADLARLTPWPLSRLKNVQPGIDMGRDSQFQSRLQALSLPENARVRVFLATNDRIVDPGDRRLWQVVARVRGKTVWLPGATHESAVGAAADWLRAERTRVAGQARGLSLAQPRRSSPIAPVADPRMAQ